MELRCSKYNKVTVRMRTKLEPGSVGHAQSMGNAQPDCLLLRTVTQLALPLPSEPQTQRDISQYPKPKCSRQAGYSRQDQAVASSSRAGNSPRMYMLSLSTSVTKPTVCVLLQFLLLH